MDPFNDFGQRSRFRLQGYIKVGGVFKIFDEGTVKAIENGEFFLLDVRT